MSTPGNPNVVVGQPTPQEAAAAGAGGGAASNPWAEYGLNPDGTPIGNKPAPDAEKASLEAKVAHLEAQLAKLPEGFEAQNKKLALLDRLVGALKGEEVTEQGDAGKFREIWSDLKKVAGSQAPGVQKLLSLLEADPNYLDRLESANSALMSQHVIGVNERAHNRVIELAKKAGFKGAGGENDLADMVFPFEQSMTMMINANPELRRAFLSGDVAVVDDIFNRLIRPHVAQRLASKKAKSDAAFGTPKATPRGGATPAQATEEGPKRDFKTPKGRADFHKQAVARWIGKTSGDSE